MIIKDIQIDSDTSKITLHIDEYPDKIYYSEEFMFEFAKWINNKYIRLQKGWLTTEDNTSRELFTTKELLEEFKKIRNVSE